MQRQCGKRRMPSSKSHTRTSARKEGFEVPPNLATGNEEEPDKILGNCDVTDLPLPIRASNLKYMKDQVWRSLVHLLMKITSTK